MLPPLTPSSSPTRASVTGQPVTASFAPNNYRSRVLKKLQIELGLPKLNFQVLRRTIATLAQSMGSVKDLQAILGHSNPDVTASVYMQAIESSVKTTLEAIYAELTLPSNKVVQTS